jgi:dienelactone hydrolase
MAELLLFHHALGLTPGVLAFADRLRAAGHTVRAPDLFDGEVFTSLVEGVRHAEHIGFDQFVERVTESPTRYRRRWCTPASRWASCRRSTWPRPAGVRSGRS